MSRDEFILGPVLITSGKVAVVNVFIELKESMTKEVKGSIEEKLDASSMPCKVPVGFGDLV